MTEHDPPLSSTQILRGEHDSADPVHTLREAKEKATLATRVSGSAGYWVLIPSGEWFQLLHAIDGYLADVEPEREEN